MYYAIHEVILRVKINMNHPILVIKMFLKKYIKIKMNLCCLLTGPFYGVSSSTAIGEK